MLRSFTLCCLIAALTLSTAFAQNADVSAKDKVTPEVLALFNESFQALAQVESMPKVGALFQLLGFAVDIEDKASAKKVAEVLMALAPTVEPEDVRTQLYAGIAQAYCDLEEYTGALTALQRITKPADRYKSQLDIAAKILFGQEQDKTLKPVDAAGLIRQAASSAAEAKDQIIEAFARALLGRELARQGKKEESVAAFAEAIKTAKGLEIGDQMRIVQLIVQSQVMYDQIEGAKAAAQTIEAPEIKQQMTGALIQALVQHEKYAEAEALIKTFPADGGRDWLIQHWILANIKTVTDAKIGELSALIAEGQRDRVLQAVVAELQKNNRGDVAVQVSKLAKESAGVEMALFLGKFESLLEEKRFAEAIALAEQSEKNEAIRQQLKRQVLTIQFEVTHDEAVVQKIAETYTDEEKLAITARREEATQAPKIADSGERLDTLFGVLQEQFQMMDIAGAKQTMKLVAEQLLKETDLIQVIQSRLLLARLQLELQDKSGVKENLGKLGQLLDVKNLAELKSLAPEPPATPAGTNSGAVKLDLPGVGGASAVNEPAIRDQLFQVYVTMADLYAKADAKAESKSAFEKAKELAKVDTVALQRAEKLLILATFLVDPPK